ncbi:CRISPR-associated Cas3 family helicase [Cohnella phaseoli]|uniref:CRISPR-associated Cas3 family helicase n=1 Tax=Cohnella phaseoli TaxID=456490 RepID=A0A3D9JNY5_9BACL|nr:CRISPR-associated Cas3 family helicase [Cohnella phaseoli]
MVAEYVAHVRAGDGASQSVKGHLLEVRQLAEGFGEKIGVKHIAGLAGVLHDLGKYTQEFQQYLEEAVSNPDTPPKRGSVDHATAGGKLLYERLHSGQQDRYPWILAEVVGNTIISHHAYLHDFLNESLESDYLRRVRDKELCEFEEAKGRFFEEVMGEAEFRQYVSKAVEELEAYLTRSSSESNESKLMFLAKYVFSALIDADRSNTRAFEEDQSPEPEEDRKALFSAYYDKLMERIAGYAQHEDADSSINRLRREMSEQCERFGARPSGIYTLSIPTGGGKTLASLRYALRHAIDYGMKRIIYIVPFTTIIEQNAAEVRSILGDDGNLLEHHSNVAQDDDEDEEEDGRITVRQKLKLAKDNWDSPIIFSTMVQFLDIFYAKGSRSIRRLHNLSEAVIIFDEVQKVPVKCVSLFNHALNFLKTYGKSSLILCTATQPALDFVERKLDVSEDREMVERLDRVVDAFKRVEIIDRATEEVYDSDKLADFVAEKIGEVQSVLVILNTKTVVKRLFGLLEGSDVPVFHLSTSMCAAHRKQILDQVKEHLSNEDKVICISTQLIEAGVDVSFDCVIRSLAGLDSIAQAAGRCNRHGKRGIQNVYVIDHAEENLSRLPEIEVGKRITRKILTDLKLDSSKYSGQILSVGAMERYFKEFYKAFESSLNYSVRKLQKNMVELLMTDRNRNSYNLEYRGSKGQSLPLFIVNSYRTAAEYFEVIESMTTSVLAPYGDEGKELIAELNGAGTIENLSQLLRKAQQYSVNVFKYELDKLAQNDGLVSLLDGKVWALRAGAYHQKFGLDAENDSGFDLGIF